MPTNLRPVTLHDDAVRAARQRALEKARLYVCTDARRDRGDLARFLDSAYANGVDVIQLRDKSLEARDEIEALEVLSAAARRHGKLFAVNDRADVAALVGADVFHVGQGDLSSEQARALLGPDVILGRSTHSVGQAEAADDDADIDYFCVGPVWETPTKPGRDAVGLDPVRRAAESAQKPWFAIGGITGGARLDRVVGAGAQRIVVVRAVTDADNVGRAARALRDRLE
ncbi:thiamine phosphate synthase [Paramicrobacterium agarici]|uniref:Thiamine-phosphate synthase n=1 Tax=Paramicrobacterium agarici TaxID=630514 RepID=A0A2A9DZB1_9MICO|nr:thiamine phosphate synthase [Microbacterium agarici]PFG31716.1 thiamine-phosphate pyrophosphorylase [Microbacterium agarici]